MMKMMRDIAKDMHFELPEMQERIDILRAHITGGYPAAVNDAGRKDTE